jgi:hypothetical protein
MPTDPNQRAAAVGLGLRVATASVISLVVTEWFQLDQGALGMYTVHLAMVIFPYTALQKALERTTGRFLGIFYGLLLLILFRDAPLVMLALMLLGQLAFFYVYASGHFAYAALMGGLFTGVMAATGIATPDQAIPYATALVLQLLSGALAVVIVNYFSGAERTFAIQAAGDPLWPPRVDWINRSAMFSTAQVGAMLMSGWLNLPVLPTMITATILGATANTPLAIGHKSVHRALGAVLGATLGAIGLLLVALAPYFPLLLAIAFFGMFIAAYYTKTSVTYSYAFLQMGMVFPMVLIGTHGMVGTVETGVLRLVGVVAGLFVSEFVLLVWPIRLGLDAPIVPLGDAALGQRR